MAGSNLYFVRCFYRFQEVLIVTLELFPSLDLNELSQLMLKRINKEFPTIVVSRRPIQVNNFEAQQVIYSLRQGDLDLKVRQVWLLKDNQAYIFTYKAEKQHYDKYNQLIQQMISSFEI